MRTLPVRTKLAYGAADFGFSAAYTVVAFYLLKFMVDVVGLRPALAGTALLIGKIWDALIDPYIGHFSDRHRTGWGRRRPFLLWFCVPYGLSFVLIWLLPPIANQWLLAGAFTVLNMLFITFFSLLAVPYNALGPELTRDYDDRTSITAYRMAFSIVGGLAASALPLFLVEAVKPVRSGYALMGGVFGSIVALCPLIAFFGTREEADDGEGEAESFWSGVAAAVRNKPFLLSLLGFLANWVAVDVVSAVFLFYLVYYMRLREAASQPVLFAVFAVAALCLPLWVRISARIGKKNAYIAGLGYLAAVLLAAIFLPPGRPGLVYLLAVAAGVGISAAHVIPYSIIPDAVEYDELHSGRNREGVYFGLVTFLQQLASSGALFLVGLTLELSGYVPNAVQSARALWGIRLLLGAAPALLLLLGILAMVSYPITRDAHAGIVAELASRRQSRTIGAAR